MRKTPILLALFAASLVAGCMETDGDRALAGAAAGAIIADATDNNVVAGAALIVLLGLGAVTRRALRRR